MMDDTVVLGGVEVELSSDIGHRFVVDCTRAAESLISDKDLAEIWEISPADWQNIVKNAALGRAIRAERDQRVLSGAAAREAASRHFVKAPGILNAIMSDEQINARSRIDAAKELRQVALPENNTAAQNSERFVIKIVMGDETVTYNKSIAVDANDTPPNEQSKKLTTPEQPKLTLSTNKEFENDE
jgi:hypothetical protein